MPEQRPWQIVMEIVFQALLIGGAIYLWITIGGENLRAWWAWQIEPYTDLYDRYGRGFFAQYGQAFLVVGGIILVLAFFRVSIFAAKIVLAFCLAYTALYVSESIPLDPPRPWFLPAVAAAAVWLIFIRLWGGISMRNPFRAKPFGNAKWARPWQLWWKGLTKKGGLFLGRSWFRDLYHNTEGHIFSLGGTGGGKSSGMVVPALLELTQGSVIVTDPSGELAAMTHRHRATIGDVILLNPFHATFKQGEGMDFKDDGFNPLSFIDAASPDFMAQCNALARYLMVTDRAESGSYFNDDGAAFLSLMVGYIKLYAPPEDQNLCFLYELTRDRPEQVQATLEEIMDHGHPSIQKEAEGFFGILKDAGEQWQGVIRKAAIATARYAPSTPLGEHTKKNGFDLADLKRKNMTVYLMVPTGQLPTALPWMNMLIGVFGLAIGRPGTSHPVTLLVDEAPSLGFLPDLIPFMAQFRKSGLRVWIFTQTIAQLADPKLYGRAGVESILGLSSVKQFFALQEPETWKLVSDLCGQRSAANVREGKGGDSAVDVGVPLIRPEKVRGLRQWQQIIIMERLSDPIKGWLVPYFKRHRWRRLTDRNPYVGK